MGFVEDAPLGYSGVHRRLERTQGSARDYLCMTCGREAEEWAYDGADPNELRDDRGRPYSQNPDRYRPMCVPCHRFYDAGDSCRKGHAWTVENTYNSHGQRYCRECRKLYMRQYNEKKRRQRTDDKENTRG